MQNRDAKELLDKYRKGKATKEEVIFLLNSIQNFEIDRKVEFTTEELEVVRKEMLTHVAPSILQLKPTTKLWPRIAAAASIILALSIGSYFLLHKRPVQQVAQNEIHDLEPGSNKAILTIGNGRKIILNGAHNGHLAIQGNVIVNKTEDGQVVYQDNEQSGDKTNAVIYNTMTTPRGGKYDLILADGTKVWLDAASSITYPTAFIGKDREVKMTGQAYFEVAHNAARPFRVTVNGQLVEVLGTHFNINAYADEPDMKTTLLEGKVKITKGDQSAVLTPGDQSTTITTSNRISVSQASVEESTAWKDGHFHFESNDIQFVMRQLARWYDVDVEYNGNIPRRAFSGDIDRNSKASVALQILSISGVHFKIENKKIIVTP